MPFTLTHLPWIYLPHNTELAFALKLQTPHMSTLLLDKPSFVILLLVVDEQAAAPMVCSSYPGCEIPRSGFAFHSSHNSKALSQLDMVQYLGCKVVDSRALPNYVLNCHLPIPQFRHSIEHSADLVEPVFQVRVMAAP